MSSGSFLYSGRVVHQRFGAKPHALRYRMFMALLDLDDLDALDSKLRLFSRNRFNLFSFYDRDHTDSIGETDAGTARADGNPVPRIRDAPSLRGWVEAALARAGIALDGGTIQLLSLPRILGYAFNPLSVYFCHRTGAGLVAILYEVRNTFGQRHTYLIPVEAQEEGPIVQSCAKTFYVSPFMDMDMTYAFRVVGPGATLSIGVDGLKGDQRMIATSFSGTRRPLSDGQLLRSFLGHPFISLAVVAGIHWEALKLWLKGVALQPRPAPPAHSVSIIARKEV